MSIMDRLAEELGPEPDWATIDDDIREMRRGARLRAETSVSLLPSPYLWKLFKALLILNRFASRAIL